MAVGKSEEDREAGGHSGGVFGRVDKRWPLGATVRTGEEN